MNKLENRDKTLRAQHFDSYWDEKSERIYRTETNFMKDREDSFSYPFSMQRSIDHISPVVHSKQLGLSERDLHRHVDDSLSIDEPNHYVTWPIDNEMTAEAKRLFVDAHYEFAQEMVKSMDEQRGNKRQFSLLPKATHIRGMSYRCKYIIHL